MILAYQNRSMNLLGDTLEQQLASERAEWARILQNNSIGYFAPETATVWQMIEARNRISIYSQNPQPIIARFSYLKSHIIQLIAIIETQQSSSGKKATRETASSNENGQQTTTTTKKQVSVDSEMGPGSFVDSMIQYVNDNVVVVGLGALVLIYFITKRKAT